MASRKPAKVLGADAQSIEEQEAVDIKRSTSKPREEEDEFGLAGENIALARYADLIRVGDFEGAQQALQTAALEQEALDKFKKDLSPEALAVDRLRAFQERREGKTPSNQLSKLPVFGGEQRSAFDLEDALEQRKQGSFKDFQRERRSDAQIALRASSSAAQIASNMERLRILKSKYNQGNRSDNLNNMNKIMLNTQKLIDSTTGNLLGLQSTEHKKLADRELKRLRKLHNQADGMTQFIIDQGEKLEQ